MLANVQRLEMSQTLTANLHESLPYDWIPDNHYGRRYLKFVLHYKSIRDWTCKKQGFHRHHILPRHYGRCDEPFNLVPLTLREHAISHILLYKATKNNKDAWAVCRTLRDKSGTLRKTKFLETYSHNPEISQETKDKMRRKKKELVKSGWKPHNAGTGGQKKPEAVQAAKKAWETRRKNGNHRMSEEQKIKIRESVKRTKSKRKMI